MPGAVPTTTTGSPDLAKERIFFAVATGMLLREGAEVGSCSLSRTRAW
ncbi:hypothetical protein ACJWDR_02760 [Streptomyces tauricus]